MDGADGDDDAVRGELLAARREAEVQRDARAADFEAFVEGADLVNTDDEHDPEGATIAFERSQIGALAGQVRDHLAEIDAAIQRLEAGAYGTCERCGRPIGEDRLEARPAARTCISCAEHGRR